MHKRPTLGEAINTLEQLSPHNSECAEALQEYYVFKEDGHQFFGARMLIDIVDHFNHLNEVNAING